MQVMIREEETFDQLLRRFKSAGELRREKAKAAARRRSKGRRAR